MSVKLIGGVGAFLPVSEKMLNHIGFDVQATLKKQGEEYGYTVSLGEFLWEADQEDNEIVQYVEDTFGVTGQLHYFSEEDTLPESIDKPGWVLWFDMDAVYGPLQVTQAWESFRSATEKDMLVETCVVTG